MRCNGAGDLRQLACFWSVLGQLKHWLPLVAILCLGIPPGAGAGGTQPDLVVQAWMGYGVDKPLVIEGRWAPAFARVINNGPSIRGELRVNAKGENAATVLAVDLPEHSDKVFCLPLLAPEQNALFEVSLREGWRERAREAFSAIPRPPKDRLILLLAPQNDAPTWIAQVVETCLARSGLKEARAFALAGRPELLGGDLETLHSLHAIVWDGASLRGLDPDAVSLLLDWVETGGILICAGGPDGSLLAQSPLASALPAKMGDLRPLKLGPESEKEALGRPLARRRGEAAWGPQDEPWAVVEERGRGRIVALAPSLRDETAKGCTELRRLLAYWLRPPKPFLIDFLRPEWANFLVNAHNASESRPVPFQTVFLWVAAYIILAGPANFLFFRRLRRPELAWAVGVVLAGGACVFMYFHSPLAQGRPISVLGVQFVEPVGNSELCRTQTTLSLRSLRRRTLTLSVPPGATGLQAEGYQSAPAVWMLRGFYGPGSPWSGANTLGAAGKGAGELVLGAQRRFRGLRLPAAAARSVEWTAWERRPSLPRVGIGLDSRAPKRQWQIWGTDPQTRSGFGPFFVLNNPEIPAQQKANLEPSDFLWPVLQDLGAGSGTGPFLDATALLPAGEYPPIISNMYYIRDIGWIRFKNPEPEDADSPPVYLAARMQGRTFAPVESNAGPIEVNGTETILWTPPRPEPPPILDRWDWRQPADGPSKPQHLDTGSEIPCPIVEGSTAFLLDLYPRGTQADEVPAPPSLEGRHVTEPERSAFFQRLANLWREPIPLDQSRPMTFSLHFRAGWATRESARSELAVAPKVSICAPESGPGASRPVGQGFDLAVSGILAFLGGSKAAQTAIDPYMYPWLARTRFETAPASGQADLSDLHLRVQFEWPEGALPQGKDGRIVLSDLRVALSPLTSERIARMTLLEPSQWLVESGEPHDSD